MKRINQTSSIKSPALFSHQAQWAMCILLLISSVRTYAQADIHFSQFYETSILRNPALTGVFSDDYKVGAYYRNQWNSISNPFTTFLISAETHFKVRETSEDFISIGLLSYYDKAGSVDQKITTVYPALNYNKSLNSDNSNFLSFGFTGGYNQYSYDPSKATFNNQYVNGQFNPINPTLENLPNAQFSLWDLGAGINYNTTSRDGRATYIIGFSGYHFTEPKFSYYQQAEGITEYMRLNGNASVGFNVNDQVAVQLHGNYATQGTYREIIAGGLVSYTELSPDSKEKLVLSGGLFYRYGDAIIPVVKVSYKRLAVGVSYDVNVSTLTTASNMQGGFEMTLFYTGSRYSDNDPTRKTLCPTF